MLCERTNEFICKPSFLMLNLHGEAKLCATEYTECRFKGIEAEYVSIFMVKLCCKLQKQSMIISTRERLVSIFMLKLCCMLRNIVKGI
ncbi:MAG: hypothetical protein BAJALOKI1v1_150027 [Promethearchaeota archaeon]|nr:MAG: hypothetical protein BAJALOKI1v1_150027 [Candidatus Lokiarchaeota archaeon]